MRKTFLGNPQGVLPKVTRLEDNEGHWLTQVLDRNADRLISLCFQSMASRQIL